MPVPPAFTSPGHKAGEGAITKTSLTVMRTEWSAMETDAPKASEVQRRPPVPLPQPVRPKDKEPCMVDEASMKKWSNDMLRGHPGGRVTTWEQWSNSLALQFKGAMDTMSQSLRIREDAYANMFEGKEKALKESKGNLKKIKDLEEKVASLSKPDNKVKKPETDNAFLREKLQVSEEKLKSERDCNINLFSTIRMNLKALKEATLGSTDEERKRFLSCQSEKRVDLLYGCSSRRVPPLRPRWCVIHENG